MTDQLDMLPQACVSDLLKVALHLLYETGLRISEVCAARVRDLKWVVYPGDATDSQEVSGRKLAVVGKGNKLRMVPVSPMTIECVHGRLHLNDDWVMLEPVDATLRPVPPGVTSHSVLLTNLANHAQPLIRYRLSDSVRFIMASCSCDSRFPVIEVQGRADDTLHLLNNTGRSVSLLPLALMTALDEGAHVTQFQLLQTGPRGLELRLESGVPDPLAALDALRTARNNFLMEHGLGDVRIQTSRQPPERHPRSGKGSRVLMTQQHRSTDSTPTCRSATSASRLVRSD